MLCMYTCTCTCTWICLVREIYRISVQCKYPVSWITLKDSVSLKLASSGCWVDKPVMRLFVEYSFRFELSKLIAQRSQYPFVASSIELHHSSDEGLYSSVLHPLSLYPAVGCSLSYARRPHNQLSPQHSVINSLQQFRIMRLWKLMWDFVCERVVRLYWTEGL